MPLELRKSVLKNNARIASSSAGNLSESASSSGLGQDALAMIQNDTEAWKVVGRDLGSVSRWRYSITSNPRELTSAPKCIVNEQCQSEESCDISSSRWQLNDRFWKCVEKESTAPDVEDLKTTYSDASKEDLFFAVTICAKWIVLGTRIAILKGQNNKTVETLFAKWQKCHTEGTTHAERIPQRSTDDVRELLIAVWADALIYIEEGTGAAKGNPVVKVGVALPEAGKEWY